MKITMQVGISARDDAVSIPDDGRWLDTMRERIAATGLILVRGENVVLGGGNALVAVTIGPAMYTRDEEEPYFTMDARRDGNRTFGVLLDRRCLADLIRMLQALADNFDPYGPSIVVPPSAPQPADPQPPSAAVAELIDELIVARIQQRSPRRADREEATRQIKQLQAGLASELTVID
jgi:hypothetical protein